MKEKPALGVEMERLRGEQNGQVGASPEISTKRSKEGMSCWARLQPRWVPQAVARNWIRLSSRGGSEVQEEPPFSPLHTLLLPFLSHPSAKREILALSLPGLYHPPSWVQDQMAMG